MVEGLSDADVARQLNRSPQTIWRWKNKDAFQKRLVELRSDVMSEAIEALRGSLSDNVNVIIDIAQNGADEGEEQSKRLQFAAAKWAADKILKGVDAEKTVEARSSERRNRELIVEMETYGPDDIADALERGTE